MLYNTGDASKVTVVSCPSCGKEIPGESARFCPYCAFKLEEVSANSLIPATLPPLSIHDALSEAPFEEVARVAASLPAERKLGGYHLSKGWFLKKKLFGGYEGLRAIDLCWVHPTRVATKAYGVVTTAVNWKLTLKFRPDKVAELFHEGGDTSSKLPSANVDYTTKVLQQVAPWAIFGFSQYREECWKKDRNTFLKVVDERLAAVRDAMASGKLVANPDGTLTAKDRVGLPILVYSFLKNDKGKLSGRKYESSRVVTGVPSTPYYQA
jgi:hypothetical protein